MKFKLKLIFFCFVFSKVNSLAQTDSLVMIKGEILNVNQEKIPFVKVSISGKSICSISNPEAKFQINALKTDTLVFSIIGYQTLKLPVKMLKPDYNYITLQDEIYQLNTVDVSAMRWQDFKYDMMHKELKPTEQKIVVIKGLTNPYSVFVPDKPSAFWNPATFWYEFFKKENVIKRKMKRWDNVYQKSVIKIE